MLGALGASPGRSVRGNIQQQPSAARGFPKLWPCVSHGLDSMAFDTHDTSPEVSHGQGEVVVYDAEQASLAEEFALQLQEQAEREQAELELVKAAVGTIFSVRKPRDAVAGTASGLKTMARGVGVGLASLVTLPAIGAKTGGIKGFAKGCGTGLATCVGSTVAGTLVGSGGRLAPPLAWVRVDPQSALAQEP
eukprot:s701_g23.t1